MSSPHKSSLDAEDIDRAWIDAAAAIGFTIQRSDGAYAASNGRGAIFIGARATLDDDDSLAQLVLHELCHAFVQGRSRWHEPDFGLDNTSDRDRAREQACLRLQAHLADSHGLRAAMVPTTEWRAYYVRLPADAVTDALPDDDADVLMLARAGLALASSADFAGSLQRALSTTAACLARHTAAAAATAMHPLGFAMGPAEQTCGTCAWFYQGGRGKPVDRCRQSAVGESDGSRTLRRHPACERWEAALDCQACGACCREAYHQVSVSVRDPVVWRRPHLIVRDGHRFKILREAERCAALEKATTSSDAFHYQCSIYDDRPETCRDFARGGRHCLVARRRVGMSR